MTIKQSLPGMRIMLYTSAWENDWWRLYPTMISYALYGLLQLVNLLRFPDTLSWGSAWAWIYVLFIVSIFGVGLYGTGMAQQIENRSVVIAD